MGPKYNIGDRVTVAHRMPGTIYYSYSLAGSTGTIDQMKQYGDGFIYHLDHDDIVIAHPERQYVNDKTLKRAWYNECCLDLAPLQDTIELKDFESVLN